LQGWRLHGGADCARVLSPYVDLLRGGLYRDRLCSMRMTGTTLSALAVMISEPSREMYGLEIAEIAGLASGTLYPILVRLEREGWIQGTWETIDESEAGRRRRRYYSLTGLGAREARIELSKRKQVVTWRLGGALG
jgi:PadR family transcriptional regulator, regulatory protein PadR